MDDNVRVNILLVDDRPENLLALEAILEVLGQNLVRASTGEEALRCLLSQDFAVILLDVQMPRMDGFETAALIRERERSRYTPIIFLSAFSTSEQFVFRGYSLGAVDYLLKPINTEILLSKVAVFVELFRKTEEVRRQASQLAVINTELKRSENNLQDFLDNANDLIEVLSLEGALLYVNRIWMDTLGYDKENLTAITYLDVIHPDYRRQFEEAMLTVKSSRRNVTLETVFLTRQGREVYAEGSLNCRFEHGKPRVVRCIFHDVSERKQAEQAHAQMLFEQMGRLQAEKANRMKDEFIAMVSHELRTPLNALLGWSSLLRMRQLDSATTKRALEAIERSASLQAQVIDDLLDISRIVAGKMHLSVKKVPLKETVEVALGSVRSDVEAKSIQFEIHFGPDLGSILADSNRLQQVICNLLSNAIKFTPEEGKIVVTVKRTLTNVEITVSDTGIGISKEDLPYIFDRFRQVNSTYTRSQGGLGLGLAIVKHLVELHGGKVEVQSPGSGAGATFSVFLPVNQEVLIPLDIIENQADNIVLVESETCLKGLQILVVDDEEDIRELLFTLLGELGADVVLAESAQEAFNLCQLQEPNVLISDIGMPDEDGYQLIQRLRQNGYKFPTIALTAYAHNEDYKQALAMGYDMHLSKPIDPTTLTSAIAKIVQGSLQPALPCEQIL